MAVAKYGAMTKQNVLGKMYKNIKKRYGLHILTAQIIITVGGGETLVKNFGTIFLQTTLTVITEVVVGKMMI